VGERQQLVQTNLDRLADRLPPWARGVRSWPARRVAAAVAIVVVVAVLAVSCLGGSDGRADVPVMSDGAGVGVSGVRAPSDARGGTLRVVAAEVDSLDPQRSYQPGVWNLMRLYTRTLVTYSTEPGDTGELVPDLATDLGTTDDGGKTWTFTLREGVRFETGAPITSKDVRYGIARSFDANVITGGPTTHIIDALDDPDNPYPGPYDREEGDPNLSAVKTPDDRTIVFTLRRAMPEFPYILALPSSGPVPQDADTKGDYGKDPVSSGPYAVTSVDEHAGIVFDRNEEWDPATDPVRSALPDRIVVRTGLTGVQRDQALLAGSADVDITGVGVQRPTTVRIAADDEDGELAGRVDDVTTGQVRMLAMPTNVAPMDVPDCRTAVSEAIDRRRVQEALGGAGTAGEGRAGGLRSARRLLDHDGRRRPVLERAGRQGDRRSARGGRHHGGRAAHRSRPLLRAGDRRARQREGQGLRADPHQLDRRLPDPGLLPRSAGRQPEHEERAEHELRVAAVEAGGPGRGHRPQVHRPGRRARDLAHGRRARPWHQRLRAAGGDPGAARGRSAAAQRRGHAAVRQLRPRHRRGSLTHVG
jgi:hypothetical protein